MADLEGETEYPSLSNFSFGTLASTFTFVQMKNVSATQGVNKNPVSKIPLWGNINAFFLPPETQHWNATHHQWAPYK